MQFFSSFFTPKISTLEHQASDSLELPNDLKALRVNGTIFIIDTAKNKIADQLKDIYPSNPARATFEILKKLGTTTQKQSKEIWTCGFRDSEDRWVWYRNSEPQMTVSFKEAHPNESNDIVIVEKMIDFCSAKFGTKIIEKIQKDGIKKAAKDLNALILENPYSTIKCSSCNTSENYTIDDLVDENKVSHYDANFVICSNCNKLVKLL
jgi:hypothetical protein